MSFLFTEHWPDEMFFSDLDSSLKKNSAFIKKLKSLPVDPEGREALLTEMSQLNLVKYIDEVANALAVERKFKVKFNSFKFIFSFF